jgi:hypothetical protein
MIRFRWLVALLVALSLPASTLWAQQVTLGTLAMATPLGQETPEGPAEVTPPVADNDDCAACCALQRLIEELLAKWALLWDSGEYRHAENVAAAAVAECPQHVEARHALVVSQLVNAAKAATPARWGYCISGRVTVPPVGPVVCEEVCFELCRGKETQHKPCCPAEKCVVKGCCAAAKAACANECARAKPCGVSCQAARPAARRCRVIIEVRLPFIPGLTPAGVFTPDLAIPIGCPPPLVSGIHLLPPPALMMHMGPQSIITAVDSCPVPPPVVYAPAPPSVYPTAPVCAPPAPVTRMMPGYPVQARPPMCPVVHNERVAAPPQEVRGEHRPLRISADGAGVRVHSHLFDGRCDHVTLKEHDGCIVLVGNVQIEIRGRNHPAVIRAHRVRVHLKDGTVTIDGAREMVPPHVHTEPISRPMYSAPMPRPAPTTAPVPRPQRSTPATSCSPTQPHEPLNGTEDSRPINRAWRSILIDQPSQLKPIRVHGGIGP